MLGSLGLSPSVGGGDHHANRCPIERSWRMQEPNPYQSPNAANQYTSQPKATPPRTSGRPLRLIAFSLIGGGMGSFLLAPGLRSPSDPSGNIYGFIFGGLAGLILALGSRLLSPK
jgi:hypothetical protein